jgi:hypothetical protein
MRPYSEYSKEARCVQRILVIGNFIFCLLGAAVIAIGIYLLISKIQFTNWILGTQIMAASCGLIIAAGSIMFLISFVGCFGTLFENQTLILAYCVVLALVFLSALMGSVLAIIFSTWVTDMVRVFMVESLLVRYGHEMDNDYNNLVTRSWDEAQERWQCCSVDDRSWSFYRQSYWYKDFPGKTEVTKPFVPASCCIKNSKNEYVNQFACQMSNDGPPGQRTGVANNYIYYQGCYTAGKKILNDIAIYFIVIGFVFGGIVICGVVCSLIFYRHL